MGKQRSIYATRRTLTVTGAYLTLGQTGLVVLGLSAAQFSSLAVVNPNRCTGKAGAGCRSNRTSAATAHTSYASASSR